MKRLVMLITTAAIASAVSLTACGNLNQQPEETVPSPEETSSPEAAVPQTKEVYQQQLASQLQALDSQITQLQTQSEQSQVADREKVDKQITELIKKLQARSQLNAELDKEMAELLEQLQTQEQSNPQLEQLLQKQEALKGTVEQLKSADADNWEKLKPEIKKALKDFEASDHEAAAPTKTQ